MVCLIAAASLVSGCSILLLKIVDTILQMGDFSDHWLHIIGLIAAVIFTGDT